jgi:hypothetical protein
MNDSNRSSGDPNDCRGRVGERRKRGRVVSLFLDHGCAGEGRWGRFGRALGEGRLGARQGWDCFSSS